ncbi:MAG: hypothetical protein U1B80_09800 [Anaerolineaceae bacterium]|nr:hypothetical protein [Anaerolineaceae bacterium]
MTADLIPLAEALDFPILLLEGFGKLLPNRPAIQILRAYDKRQICLNAAPWDLHTGERPELFIPLPGTGEQAPEVVELTPGKTVRVIGASVGEKVGVLEHLHPGLTLLATGLRAPAADVRLDDKRIVTVPLANLDVIE